jgi:uroporphyrinogen decarboxylase
MDHWARIEAAIAGAAADRLPVALWRHFPDDDQHAARLAARSLEWQRKWDFDLVKFMPSGTYGVEDWGARSVYEGAANGARAISAPGISKPEDWRSLPRLDVAKGVLGAQNESLALVARELRGQVPILQTVFSPLTTARKLAGEALLEQARSAPEALERGLRTITDTTIEFSRAALRAGAHGLFFATQLATTDALTPAEYERFGVRFDLEVLREAHGRLTLLHLHGENVMFDLLASYPVQMINWHDRITAPRLRDAMPRFQGALVGGIEERDLLVSGPVDALRAQVRDAIRQTGGRRLVLGPGCVAAIAASDEHIRAVIEEARNPT